MNRCTLIVVSSLTALAGSALGNPVQGVYNDLPGACDSHGTQFAFEELGMPGVFPADELIDAVSAPTPITACPPTDDPTIPNVVVEMTNLTNVPWQNLFYVADPDTTFSNVDGEAVSFADASGLRTLAFRIDSVGLNKNLIFESGASNGIFEPGETWQFIVQDYSNSLGLSASSFLSLDFAGASAADSISSASIIAFDPVPTPGAVTMLALAGLGVSRRRRS